MNKKGFSLIELLAVLVILALLVLLVSNTVVNIINKAKTDISAQQEKTILNAAEKWSIDNSDKFDDTEGTKIQVGLDIVFVVDVSGSMEECVDSGKNCKTRYVATIEAINGALDVLSQNEKSRIAFVFYSTGTGESSSYGKTIDFQPAPSIPHLTTSTSNYSTPKINVGSTSVSVTGGTYTQGGFVKASELLVGNVQENQIPVIILLTDGQPTYGYGKTSSGTKLTMKSNYDSNPTKYNSKNGGSGSDFSSELGWHLINNSALATAAIKDAYGTEPFIYTIALGLEEKYIQYILDPTEEKFNALKDGDSTDKDLYNDLDDYVLSNGSYNQKYDYVNEAFYGQMTAEDLNKNFQNIAAQVTEATKVSMVCVTVKELYDSGYLSKSDIELSDGEAASEYVLMSYNEPTNQFKYSFARTDKQKTDCQEYLKEDAEG